ncbi:MAG: hypothetical protein AAF432_03780 [Planctomycetota bacterium]
MALFQGCGAYDGIAIQWSMDVGVQMTIIIGCGRINDRCVHALAINDPDQKTILVAVKPLRHADQPVALARRVDEAFAFQ